jgi:uncharacterized membrane protein YfcA
VTFPTLLAVGLPPVTANVTNTVGLVAGSLSGTFGYRGELAEQGPRLRRLAVATVLGTLVGAWLLLSLPEEAFSTVVPVLILVACALVALQPWIARRLAGRERHPHGGVVVWLLVLATGVYAGYFGAAQGVILLALMGIALPDDLQRLNALKNVLAALVNGVAAVVFVFFATVAWLPALLLAISSAAGGQLGARIGRRLSPDVLRGVIVVVGIAAIVQLVS